MAEPRRGRIRAGIAEAIVALTILAIVWATHPGSNRAPWERSAGPIVSALSHDTSQVQGYLPEAAPVGALARLKKDLAVADGLSSPTGKAQAVAWAAILGDLHEGLTEMGLGGSGRQAADSAFTDASSRLLALGLYLSEAQH